MKLIGLKETANDFWMAETFLKTYSKPLALGTSTTRAGTILIAENIQEKGDIQL